MQVETLLVPAITAAGWLGQACFCARFLVQWLASERAGDSIVPPSFWWLSLAGTALMCAYAHGRGAGLLLVGFLLNGVLAARNLVLARCSVRRDLRWVLLIALGIAAGSLWAGLAAGERAGGGSRAWLVIAVLGQALWTARFPVQWIASERAGRSHFPRAFWWLSLAGNGLLLAYALHLRDPVFVLGFLPGPLLQGRNLFLARRGARLA